MKEESQFKKLFSGFSQVGHVTWIGIRPQRKAELYSVEKVQVLESKLEGDHYSGKAESKRQVTFIQEEHILAISSFMNKNISPSMLRRNVVVKGINLLAFKDGLFQIGEAIFEMTGLCHPCSRMEENLGPGGYNAVRGHGGITARIRKPGLIQVGDSVKWLPAKSSNQTSQYFPF